MEEVAHEQLDGAEEEQECDVDLVREGDTPFVQVTALPADKSNHAFLVLQERMIRNDLVKNSVRTLQCKEVDVNLSRGPNLGASERLVNFMWSLMPCVTVFRAMNWDMLRSDIIAGLTVGVMVIPQSMSYANIAGLQYIYGMYSACVPTLIYALFGQSRQLAVGPVAMVSLLVEAGLRGQVAKEKCPGWDPDGDLQQYDVCPAAYAELAFLCSAMVGMMQILAAVFRISFLVKFLGHPVISGFTSGAAIIIGLSQLQYILGFDIKKSQFVYVTIGQVFEKLGDTTVVPLFLGSLWLAYLIGNRYLARKNKTFAQVAPLGPLICCAVGTLLVVAVKPLSEDYNVEYVGDIPRGMIPVSVDQWDFSAAGRVLPTAAVATLIGFMESIAIGKNLAQKNGYELEAGQELFALGMSNLVGAAFSCYPVTGSFSRSAVNNQTGARTQLSGIITAVVMFFTLLFLTPLFFYLPKFALAAIVMSSVIPLVAFGEACRLWKMKISDFVLWMCAFIGTLFLGVLMGITVAVGLSLVIVIFESVRPQVSVLWRLPGTTMYRTMKQEGTGSFVPGVFIARIGSSLYFANAAYVKDMLLAYIEDIQYINPTEYVVLEMTPVISVDSSAVHMLHDVAHDFRNRGIQVVFVMVGNRVHKTMKKDGLIKYVGEQWFLPTVNQAVEHCVRHRHAKERSKAEGSTDVSRRAESKSSAIEVGFSNQLHEEATSIHITLAKDLPFILSEITAAFRSNSATVLKAQVEPTEKGGARHTYQVQSAERKGKLTEVEIQQLQQDVLTAIQSAQAQVSGDARDPAGLQAVDRVKQLEESLIQERQASAKFQGLLDAHGRRLDELLAEKASELKNYEVPIVV